MVDLWKDIPPTGGVIGKRGVRRIDGYGKASGRAVFTKDVILPGMLYGRWFLSPYAHAKIKSMDTSKAEALPGVKTVLRYDDPEVRWEEHEEGIGHEGAICPTPGDFTHRHWVFVLPSEATYEGCPVGVAVAADTLDICDEALKLVKIEWEELPFILDMEEAMKAGAPITQFYRKKPNNMRSDLIDRDIGDVEKGFKEADKVVEFEVKEDVNVSTCAEQHSCVANWHGDYLEVWHKGQTADLTQNCLYRSLPYDISMNKINVIASYQGATFGGSAWPGNPHCLALLTAILAKRTCRPVKVEFPHSQFIQIGEDFGHFYFKLGVKNDGTITAVKLDPWVGIEFDPLGKTREGTKIENMYSHTLRPYVNLGPDECWRHGTVNTVAANMILNHAAAAVELDPTKVALINDGCAGEPMELINEEVKKVQGFDPTRDSLKECVAAGKAAIDWDNKWHAPGTKKLPNGKMHGLGFMSVIAWSHNPGPPWIGVSIRDDGTVSILARQTDVGVSGATTYAQVVADEMGLKYEDVAHRPFDDVAFEGKSPGGSGGCIAMVTGLVPLARDAKLHMLEIATGTGRHSDVALPRFKGMTPEQLDIKNSEIFEKANPSNKKTVYEVVSNAGKVKRCGRGITIPVLVQGRGTGPSVKPLEVMVRQCHFMEVEVDTDTGGWEVTKIVDVNDAGRVMNPEAYNGQQYGGAYQSLSRGGKQEVVYDPVTGVMLNNNLIGYSSVAFGDIKAIDCIIVETGLSYGAYGTCGVGENCNAVTSLIGPAIYNAIGKWVDDYPITPDKVLKALGKI